MIAEKTGWHEDFILWELPLHRALAYQHCALWSGGAWTIEPQAAPEAQLDACLTSLPIVDDEED